MVLLSLECSIIKPSTAWDSEVMEKTKKLKSREWVNDKCNNLAVRLTFLHLGLYFKVYYILIWWRIKIGRLTNVVVPYPRTFRLIFYSRLGKKKKKSKDSQKQSFLLILRHFIFVLCFFSTAEPVYTVVNLSMWIFCFDYLIP